MSNTVKLKGVKNDQIISIEISGAFLLRLQGLYHQFVKLIGHKKTIELMAYIKEEKLDDIKNQEDLYNAFSLETLLLLIKSLEHSFIDNKMVEEVEVELPEESNED